MRFLFLLCFLLGNQLLAQTSLTSDMLERYAFRFTIDDQNNLKDSVVQKQWNSWIGENQFVGIAEVHNSRQLSLFTTALLPLLSEQDFECFALELGPNTAAILNRITSDPKKTTHKIRELNNQYGKKSRLKTPLIFVNKKADALFMERASMLGFTFWGLDQEYAFSYEMLIDEIYALEKKASPEMLDLYNDVKKLMRKKIFRKKAGGQPIYCWYQSNELLNNYFDHFKDNPKAMKIISDIRESWDIYCKSASGQGSNQQRANYMKKNFESYYSSVGEQQPKVLLKLGGVHLTHGISPFGVNDMGEFLHERSLASNAGFLSIRHLIPYRNGRSNIGKSGWKAVEMFLKLGQKDKWTAVDLRPFRKQLQERLITANKAITYELMNYDILLLSPDDQYGKPNY
ncbi:MAG: hypothetical protein R2828_01850 [Saprospiraceae bacterium]